MVNWIESPPLLTSSNCENEIVWEKLKNMQSWSILKDKRSDLIFVTRKRLVNWANLNPSTTVSQISRHVFCTKVYTNNRYLSSVLYQLLYGLSKINFIACYRNYV